MLSYLETLFSFYNFLVFALIFLILLIICIQNPIYVILCWLFIYFFIFIFLIWFCDLEFLPNSILTIYMGAVIVIFLFIVMMLNLQISYYTTVQELIWLILFVFKICIVIYFILPELIFSFEFLFELHMSISNDYKELVLHDIVPISYLLYKRYGFELLLTAVILWISMVGSIAIAYHTPIKKSKNV